MTDREVKQIASPDHLEKPEVEEKVGERDGDHPENERPPNTIAQGPLLSLFRKVAHHHRQDEGVVSAEKTFEKNQPKDRETDHRIVGGDDTPHAGELPLRVEPKLE